jgi:P27 family predicted phage terminase small subunit
MPRGRPPKPIERARVTARDSTHKADGRPLPVIQGTIVKDVVVPDPPSELGGRGTTEWAAIWEAGRAWLAPAQDYRWVEMICHAYDDIEGFRARVKRDGLIAKGSQGQVIAHPLIAEIRRAEASIQKCLSVLGFSPSDRARLGLAEIKARSKLQDMMAKGGQ